MGIISGRVRPSASSSAVPREQTSLRTQTVHRCNQASITRQSSRRKSPFVRFALLWKLSVPFRQRCDSRKGYHGEVVRSPGVQGRREGEKALLTADLRCSLSNGNDCRWQRSCSCLRAMRAYAPMWPQRRGSVALLVCLSSWTRPTGPTLSSSRRTADVNPFPEVRPRREGTPWQYDALLERASDLSRG